MPTPRTRPTSPALSPDEIYARIYAAIVGHRIAPGAQLTEERLCTLFGCTRARVRQVLARLAADRVVTLQPNRGAFVTEPTIDETREVFELRRLIEPPVVRELAGRRDRTAVRRLRAHIAAEAGARRGNDRQALIRLSGEFHLLVAELHGNGLIVRTLRELESVTSLAMHLYDAPNMPACRGHDHAEIVAAIDAAEPAGAARLMRTHLQEVESCLRLEMRTPVTVALEDALA